MKKREYDVNLSKSIVNMNIIIMKIIIIIVNLYENEKLKQGKRGIYIDIYTCINGKHDAYNMNSGRTGTGLTLSDHMDGWMDESLSNV